MAVSFVASRAWVEQTASVFGNVSIPAGVQNDDRIFAITVWKNHTVTANEITNWTKIGEWVDGAVASGNGTGSVSVAIYYRDYDGSFSNISYGWSNNTGIGGVTLVAFRKEAGESWSTPVGHSQPITNWTTSPANVQMATATANVPNGAAVLAVAGIRDDSATFTRPTNAISSNPAITWAGNYVEEPATHLSTTTNNDMAADAGYRLVTTGHAATALNQTATLSAAETGTAVWIVQAVSAGGGGGTEDLIPYVGGGYY